MMMDEFKLLAVECLEFSLTNPRKHFDDVALSELADSIRQVGIINPITVRLKGDVQPCVSTKKKKNGKYEIISGARRFKAAVTAGLVEVPCIVRDVSDEQVMEIQIIENLQRTDVNCIDEAFGFQALIKSGKYDVKEIALRVGKSENYVYNRLKLVDLCVELQDEVLSGYLTFGHAVLLSKLQPSWQLKAFQHISTSGENRQDEPDSIKQLSHWIKYNVGCNLSKLPFKLSDETLIPAAGACDTCMRRTGVNINMFPDMQVDDSCMDPECLAMKLEQHFRLCKAKEENKHKSLVYITTDYVSREDNVIGRKDYNTAKSSNECEHIERGIMVNRENKGKGFWICRNARCQVHFGGKGASGSSGTSAASAPLSHQNDEDEAQKIFNRKIKIMKQKERAEVLDYCVKAIVNERIELQLEFSSIRKVLVFKCIRMFSMLENSIKEYLSDLFFKDTEICPDDYDNLMEFMKSEFGITYPLKRVYNLVKWIVNKDEDFLYNIQNVLLLLHGCSKFEEGILRNEANAMLIKFARNQMDNDVMQGLKDIEAPYVKQVKRAVDSFMKKNGYVPQRWDGADPPETSPTPEAVLSAGLKTDLILFLNTCKPITCNATDDTIEVA